MVRARESLRVASAVRRLAAVLVWAALARAAWSADFRPPAVPLVTHDPYFSTWSCADRLTDDWPRHWTGTPQGMCGLVRIDGQPFRWMGLGVDLPALPQKSLSVAPTHSSYTFANEQIELVVDFLTPWLPFDLEVGGRPVSYITCSVRSLNGQPHHVELYLDASAEWCVHDADQQVEWRKAAIPGLNAARFGSLDQAALRRVGDHTRIDWGYFYLASTDGAIQVATDIAARGRFVRDGGLPETWDARMPRPARDQWPVMASTRTLSAQTAPVSHTWLLAYDDVVALQFLGKPLVSWWRRQGATIDRVLSTAAREFADVDGRCREFDRELMADLARVGGAEYAQLGALAFRQALAGHKLVASPEGQPWFFAKENTSNGCIATVDVIYPAAPLCLAFNPALARGQLTPVLEYAQSGKWPYAYAPHDLGVYPQANAQVYGMDAADDGTRMPVEESANAILLCAAIARAEGRADYAQQWWPLLARWAEYLLDKGFDPENQLCTDDFAGHLAHNTNLSLKAILALGAYAQLCDQVGRADDAARFHAASQDMAQKWVQAADDGDHFRLTFDRPGTWSSKYNLVWDRLLNLKLFPASVARREMDYYLRIQNRYGLPLDSRNLYQKIDWLVWTATLTGSLADFQQLVKPAWQALHDMPDRKPITDLYDTQSGKMVAMFARPVLGAVYLPLLYDEGLARKYARRAAN